MSVNELVSGRNDTSSRHVEDVPLPRYQRQARKRKEDRGLPPDIELAQLAKEYLKRQHLLWPDFVNDRRLSQADESTISAMVEDFKTRHRTAEIPHAALEKLSGISKLGGSYNRYSCHNSETTSIIDQLSNSLNKAKAEGRFIPWEYVFCDYAVSGLKSARQGYTS